MTEDRRIGIETANPPLVIPAAAPRGHLKGRLVVLAIVVIGGLITSTLLSLLVIPVVFTYIDDLLELLKTIARKLYDPHGVAETKN